MTNKNISLESLSLSATEVLACSVTELYPKVHLIDGFVNEEGFHYDFIFNRPFYESYLQSIEDYMHQLIREKHEIHVMEMMKENAMELFRHFNQPLKVSILSQMKQNIVSLIRLKEFHDLCPRLDIGHTGNIAFFKIVTFKEMEKVVTGKKVNIIRVSGYASSASKNLKEVLKNKILTKKFHHLITGENQKLFYEKGNLKTGAYSWAPNGAVLFQKLITFWQTELQQLQFEPIITGPFKISFSEESAAQTCLISSLPLKVYQEKIADYIPIFISGLPTLKHQPIRLYECKAIAYDNRNSYYTGLFAATSQHVDHFVTLCTENHLYDELISSLQFIEKTIKIFGFSCKLRFSSKFAYRGDVRHAQRCSNILKNVLDDSGMNYPVSDREEDDFSGPRIKFVLKDSLKRKWEGPSLGVDLAISMQKNLVDLSSFDKKALPVLIVGSFFCSIERFIAIYLEHCRAEALPLWLAPEQIRILPLKQSHFNDAVDLQKKLKFHDLRVRIDAKAEKLNMRMHEAFTEKIPYTIVIGDNEKATNKLTVRSLNAQHSKKMDRAEFISRLSQENSRFR